jgi:hypothetical protein
MRLYLPFIFPFAERVRFLLPDLYSIKNSISACEEMSQISTSSRRFLPSEVGAFSLVGMGHETLLYKERIANDRMTGFIAKESGQGL